MISSTGLPDYISYALRGGSVQPSPERVWNQEANLREAVHSFATFFLKGFDNITSTSKGFFAVCISPSLLFQTLGSVPHYIVDASKVVFFVNAIFKKPESYNALGIAKLKENKKGNKDFYTHLQLSEDFNRKLWGLESKALSIKQLSAFCYLILFLGGNKFVFSTVGSLLSMIEFTIRLATTIKAYSLKKTHASNFKSIPALDPQDNIFNTGVQMSVSKIDQFFDAATGVVSLLCFMIGSMAMASVLRPTLSLCKNYAGCAILLWILRDLTLPLFKYMILKPLQQEALFINHNPS